MILIISPAKKLDFTTLVPTTKSSVPSFLHDTTILIEKLRNRQGQVLSITINRKAFTVMYIFRTSQ